MSENDKPRAWCAAHRMPLASCGWRHDTAQEMEIRLSRAIDEPREHPSTCRFWRQSKCDCGATANNEAQALRDEVLASVLAEVARQEAGVKNGGVVVPASPSLSDFLVFRVGADIRQLMNLQTEAAT